MGMKRAKSGGAITLYRFMRYFHACGITPIAKVFYVLNHVLFKVVIPMTVSMGENVRLTHSLGIVIHQDTMIGDDVTIGHNVTIANPRVKIGDGCFLGTGSVIIGPVTIGNNVKIGANTVIDFDVPDNCTVVGAKGRIIQH